MALRWVPRHPYPRLLLHAGDILAALAMRIGDPEGMWQGGMIMIMIMIIIIMMNTIYDVDVDDDDYDNDGADEN